MKWILIFLWGTGAFASQDRWPLLVNDCVIRIFEAWTMAPRTEFDRWFPAEASAVELVNPPHRPRRWGRQFTFRYGFFDPEVPVLFTTPADPRLILELLRRVDNRFFDGAAAFSYYLLRTHALRSEIDHRDNVDWVFPRATNLDSQKFITLQEWLESKGEAPSVLDGYLPLQ